MIKIDSVFGEATLSEVMRIMEKLKIELKDGTVTEKTFAKLEDHLDKLRTTNKWKRDEMLKKHAKP